MASIPASDGRPMKGQRSLQSSIIEMLGILLLYIVMIAVILVFANQILNDLLTSGQVSNQIIIPFAFIVPLLLLVMVAANIGKLIREKRSGKTSTSYKIRLLLVLSALTTLSAVPHGFLSISFIDTGLSALFNSETGRALQSGKSLATTYYIDRLDSLRKIMQSNILDDYLIRNLPQNPDVFWLETEQLGAGVDTFQLYDEERTLLYTGGDPKGKLQGAPLESLKSGEVQKIDYQEVSLLSTARWIERRGRRYLVVFNALLPPSLDDAVLITRSLASYNLWQRYKTTFWYTLIMFYLFFFFPLLLLSLLISFLFSEKMIEPISDLEEAVRKVAEGDYSFRIMGRMGLGFDHLIRSFNAMISELENSRKTIIQTDKIVAWQEIAQRMAHEIKNPLTPIQLAAQRIQRKFRNDPENIGPVIDSAVHTITNEIRNLNTILLEFRNFARSPDPIARETDLKEIFEEVKMMYAALFPAVTIDTSRLSSQTRLRVDRDQIKQVFGNLIKNACESISGTGIVTVFADPVQVGDSRFSRIRIRDNGSGIGEEDQKQVFNPYYTTKATGTGLGLPIVERIIFEHKGQIWFESEKGTGTTFYIDLPRES